MVSTRRNWWPSPAQLLQQVGLVGLRSLSSLDRSAGVRIWLASEPADMRQGFDRLAERAAAVTGQDPLSGHLFLFRGRGGDRLKILYWDRDGYALWYGSTELAEVKRLEEGIFKLSRTAGATPSVELRGSELAIILDGIDLSSVKRGKRYRRKSAER